MAVNRRVLLSNVHQPKIEILKCCQLCSSAVILNFILGIVLTTEGDNFTKLTYIILNVIAKHLRELFVKKWNHKYEDWNSDGESGVQLYGILADSFKKQNKDYMTKIKNGNVQQWDTTLLCKIFLFSDLNLIENGSSKSEIDKLRKIRNECFAHPESMSCSNAEFKRIVIEIKNAAHALFGEAAKHEISGIEKSAMSQEKIEQSLIGKRMFIIFLVKCIYTS